MLQQFSELLTNQQASDNQAMEFLDNMVKNFPYCQPARILFAKALMERKCDMYEEHLKMAAACAPNRRLFKNYLAEKPDKKHSPATTHQMHPAEAEKKEKETDTAGSEKYKKARQQSIIDRFLERNPRISPGEEKNVTEGDLASGSIEDKAGLVSETLAEILLKQGKKERAIMIYNKLSLMFPEKSSYFAKKLEHIQSENN